MFGVFSCFPISRPSNRSSRPGRSAWSCTPASFASLCRRESLLRRSEEHTSELQSPCNLVCRLLLEKKKNQLHRRNPHHDLRNLPHVVLAGLDTEDPGEGDAQSRDPHGVIYAVLAVPLQAVHDARVL